MSKIPLCPMPITKKPTKSFKPRAPAPGGHGSERLKRQRRPTAAHRESKPSSCDECYPPALQATSEGSLTETSHACLDRADMLQAGGMDGGLEPFGHGVLCTDAQVRPRAHSFNFSTSRYLNMQLSKHFGICGTHGKRFSMRMDPYEERQQVPRWLPETCKPKNCGVKSVCSNVPK